MHNARPSTVRLSGVLLPFLLASPALCDVQTYTYKEVGSLKLEADVFKPAARGVLPVVMFMHGGGLIFGSRATRPPLALRERLLDAGFVVVSVDYRLAPETKLPEIAADVQDAYDWISTEGPRLFNIDPERITVMGGSAGGYLALLLGSQHLSPPPHRVVAISGYGDLRWYGTPVAVREAELKKAYRSVGSRPIANGLGDRASFYRFCREYRRWIPEVTGLDPSTEDRVAFNRLCPVRNVTAAYPPSLLVHSQTDQDVPHTQAVQMRDALRSKRVAVELFSVASGHSSGLLRDHPEAIDRIVSFVAGDAARKDPASSTPRALSSVKLEDWQVKNGGLTECEFEGKQAVRLSGRLALAYLKDCQFQDGTIELDLAAGEATELFFGLAFRVQEEFNASLEAKDNSNQKYEYIYFRPFRTGTENAIQYCAAGTNYSWSYLRDNYPGVYEAEADLPETGWFHVKVVVSGETASVFVNGSAKPNLVVEDLKHGTSRGSVGIYSYWKTAYFTNLRVTPASD